jgi:predicted anti-sigma-YlaC factor YlaD
MSIFVSNQSKATNMDCTTCQQHFEDYFNGTLSEAAHREMETHLSTCPSCAQTYLLWQKLEQVVFEEKSTSSNPYLATRIMAQIERLSQAEKTDPVVAKQMIFKPVTVALIVGVAISLGVLIGNSYRPMKLYPAHTEEMLYLNDGAIEPIAFYEAK